MEGRAELSIKSGCCLELCTLVFNFLNTKILSLLQSINFKTLNQNLQLYQVQHCTMERLAQGHQKSEIKQLINMQSLLDQYDRENKYLNQQVLQLLQENKVLKIDKIKQDIVSQLNQVTSLPKKSTVKKQDDFSLIRRWKQKIQEVKAADKPKQKKDEGVQVNSDVPNTKPLQASNLSHKKQDSQVFSFRSRISPDKQIDLNQTKRQSPSKKIKDIATSPEKIPSTHYKEHHQIELLKSPIQQFQEQQQPKHKKLQYSREQNRSDYLERTNNFSRQSFSLNRNSARLKSSHAIDPSPKIQPSKTTRNLFMHQGSKHIQRAPSFQYFRRQSTQKKKKFINVVSQVQKKMVWQGKGWCC